MTAHSKVVQTWCHVVFNPVIINAMRDRVCLDPRDKVSYAVSDFNKRLVLRQR